MKREYTRVSDDYYVHINPERLNEGETAWVKVSGAILMLEKYRKYDLFFHLSPTEDNSHFSAEISISEGKTGLSVVKGGGSFDEAIEDLVFTLEGRDFDQHITKELEKWGLSPRYKEIAND